MTEIEAAPNSCISLEISKGVTNKLVTSLSALTDYWSENIDPKMLNKAKVNIHNLSFKSNNFWVYSAINRRLYEITLHENAHKVRPYIELLSMLQVSQDQVPSIIEFCSLNKIQKCLFSRFATEGHPNSKAFQATDTEALSQTINYINEALQIIKDCLPDFYSEINNYINTFVIFTSQSMSSGSSSHLLKCIYIQTFKDNISISLLRILDRIIHETAHMHLHLFSMYDPLVLNNPNDKFDSPFRKDSRPMIGVFHAYFVLFRLILVLRNELFRTFFKIDIDEIDDMLLRYEEAYQKTYKIILKNSEFTSLGNRLFKGTIL